MPVPRRVALFAAIAIALAPEAGAAPLRVRTITAPHAAQADATRAIAPPDANARAISAGSIDALCGTRVEAASELLRAHHERGEQVALPTMYSQDVGEIAVIEDDGTLIYSDKNNNTILDLAAAARAFYRTHGDDYDQIAFYMASGLNTFLGSPTALASAFVIRNDIQGIGLDTFDLGPEFDSPARLQAILAMNGLHRYKDGPDSATVGSPDQFTPMDFLAHEFGHRWLSYVYVDSAGEPVPALLGRAYQHWNFFADVDGSVMEGCDWVRVGPDSFRTDSVTVGFGRLDRYLMGLVSAEATDSILVVNAPFNENPPGIYVPYSYPQVGFTCRGQATYWTVDDIAAVHGPRVPDASLAPHAFRVAICLVTAHGVAPTPQDLAKVEAFRARFETYFGEATRGHGTMNMSLDSHAGLVAIEHRPLADREDAAAPITVGARITVTGGGLGVAIDPSTPMLSWRFNAGPWNPAPMNAAGPDSFVATVPGPGFNGTFEYVIQAAGDAPGVFGIDPASGFASPHAFAIGPDVAPPLIVHVPVRTQGEARMPQRLLARVTDNLGLDSVWVEFAVDGGLIQSLTAAPAGRDSFAVLLGAGLAESQVLAYRFVARDDAAAHSLAFSNPAFDSLTVGRDWVFDIENGGEPFTHAPYWYSYRDAWHTSQAASSPAGGTAWRCGSPENANYHPPHLDANLYLPLIPDVAAGTTLRFDHQWELEQSDSVYAWDGARIEGSADGTTWLPIPTAAGYSHLYRINNQPFVRNSPCWSGSSGGWRSEVADLSSFAPGPVRIRFRMLADEYLAFSGWDVDHVRVQFPPALAGVNAPGGSLMIGAPYPNPARGALNVSFSLPRASRIEWSLFDLQGRRVHTLLRAPHADGAVELNAALPAQLRAGLYFSRVAIDGQAVRTDRIALVR